MEPLCASPPSQKPANFPYFVPNNAVHDPPSLFLNIHFNIIPHLRLGLPSNNFSSGFRSKNPVCTSPLLPTCESLYRPTAKFTYIIDKEIE